MFLPYFFYTSISLFSAGLISWAPVFARRIRLELFTLTALKIFKTWLIGVGISLAFLSIFTGISLTSVSKSFLLQSEVIYTMILSYFLLKEKITMKQVAASLVVVVGDIFVMTGGLVEQVSAGDILLLIAPLFFTCTNILAKDIMKTTEPSILVALRYTWGGLFLLSFQLFGSLQRLTLGLNSFQALLILTQGILLALTSSLSHFAMKKINLSKASAIFMAYPVVSTILAITFLGEKVTLIHSAGAAMIFVSILYLARLRSSLRQVI